MDWGFLWLMVGLKVPVAMLLVTVWWAIHAEPAVPEDGAAVDEGEDEGGGSDRLTHRRPPRPRTPRPRGPHGTRVPAPPRTRPATARGRRLTPR